MWVPHLADAAWVREAVTHAAEQLGLTDQVLDVQLVDVRLTNPHRPQSPLCRGWATYVVTLPGSAVQLYLKGFPDAGTSRAAWQQDRAARPAGHCHHLAEHDLVVWRFPDDPGLPALPGLVHPTLLQGLLPAPVVALLGERPEEVHATVVRYQPEASATLRLAADGLEGAAVFAKHLATGSIAEVAARHQALWAISGSSPALRVAEPLAADPSRRVLWTRAVAGAPLTEALAADELPAAAARVGALLAELHRSGVEAEGVVAVDDLLAEMRKKSAKLSVAHPDVGSPLTDLVSTASARRDAVRERRCTLHGDFHLDQLVSSPAGPVLVDLDSMVSGAPEVDLAEFLVDLALRRLPDPVADAVARELMSSYLSASGREVDAALLELCAAAEFVNRCYRHLRRHTPGWEQELEAELGRHSCVTRLLGPALSPG